MKKQKTKKKLTKTRIEHDDTAKFMPASSIKEAVGQEALELTPLAPLGTDLHRD